VRGDIVKITLKSYTAIHVCEVEVYGQI
jgi:DNA-directed RNA polymerase subunit H (RpoH/RPB5)